VLLSGVRFCSVAVFRALMLGDLLCAVPALRALRAALPEARITLIGLPWAREFAAHLPHYLDDFIPFPGWPGLPEQPLHGSALPAFLARVQGRRYDLAIQLHGSGVITNPLVALFGARRVAGFFAPGHWCPDVTSFLPWPTQGHEVERLLTLMEFLGAPAPGTELEFPVTAADAADLTALPGTDGLRTGGYVCIHPGARFRSRCWPPERFAAVADALARQGLRPVLTGSHEETPITGAVAAAMRARPVDLTGRTNLGALAALIRDARLVVSNDTGVAHLAAAVGTPSVVVAAGTDVARWAPRESERHRVLWQDVPCRPCAVADCPIGHPCALGVSVEAVVRAAEALLSGPRRPAAPPGPARASNSDTAESGVWPR
jgi:ADP-heptose:LPS heptosyltransferase